MILTVLLIFGLEFVAGARYTPDWSSLGNFIYQTSKQFINKKKISSEFNKEMYFHYIISTLFIFVL